jgi:hypothetical protein
MAAGALKPGAWVRELDIDGTITLFHTETQTALVLNDTASDVWRLLDGSRDVDDIVTELIRQYDAEEERIRTGVADGLAQLKQHRLLESP